MEGSKSPYASKTIWGSFIALIAMIAPLFGVVLYEGFHADLEQVILSTIAIGGSVYSIYGRIVADTKIE